MPLRKVWRESRSRFFFILVALLVVTSASVFYNAKAEKVVIEKMGPDRTVGQNGNGSRESRDAAARRRGPRKGKGEHVVTTKVTLAEYAEQNYFPALQKRPRSIRTYRCWLVPSPVRGRRAVTTSRSRSTAPFRVRAFGSCARSR